MPQIPSPHQPQPTFLGFDLPHQSWFKMPNEWTDITADMSSMAELKIVEYVLKHTWGYQEYGVKRSITIDEFRFGRKRKDGTRLDRGTGLSKQSVITGVKAAVKRGLLKEEVDSRDKARIRKFYSLRMKEGGGGDDEPGVKKLDADVKDLDTGVQDLDIGGLKSGHRTEQETIARNQQQENVKKSDATSASDNRELAAALMDRGIDQNVAQYFASKYSSQRIENNIDWFAWKQKNEPSSIKTNPAGLLRRAIEQDYASEGHHKGFQTRRQKAAVAAKQKKAMAAQERLVDERKREQAASLQQKEKERLKRLERLRERYHSTAKEKKLWQQVLKSLRKELTTLKFNTYLAQSELLSLREGKAIISLPTRFIRAWVEDHFAKEIQQALTSCLKGQQVAVQYHSLDALKDG